MDMTLLQTTLNNMKNTLETTITTAIFKDVNGREYQRDNGAIAKESLITSQQLINKLHETAKISFKKELTNQGFIENTDFTVHPPIGESSPELEMYGYLKKKKQDIVFLFDEQETETIKKGALKGQRDLVGNKATDTSIIIGVRSSLSSVDKNYDTLIERAYAETMNVRLKNPLAVMGEIFLIPAKEYKQSVMKNNIVEFKSTFVKITKYLSAFKFISGRKKHTTKSENYKYERSCLLIVDFDQSPVKIYTTLQELKNDNIVPRNFRLDYANLSPINFSQDLIRQYKDRHGL